MNSKSLVIVESPTKAKTIAKFLSSDYIIKASNGHVRDLPNSAEEIPADLKKTEWARLGVDIEKDFAPLYIIPKSKKEHVKNLKDALKNVSQLYLATDEDREGESISWHLQEVLNPKVPVKRLVFHEITKEAIKAAVENPREIDENLVRAQETRRIVDRLFGYEISPLLWKKMAPGLSAGRVQSVAIRLLVEREEERKKFQKAFYCDILGLFAKSGSTKSEDSFEAVLTQVGQKKVASGKDFDQNTGKLKDSSNTVVLTEDAVNKLISGLQNAKASVASIEKKPFSKEPPAPFVTSTLQQEANSKLRLPAKRTMSIAQQLYENGYITYMRTDSTTLSQQALSAARNLIDTNYGSEYLPKAPRMYATKVRNAQEAHEAIRPAGDNFTPIPTVESHLGLEAGKLYELIWKRTVASQMTNAQGTHVSLQIEQGEAKFRATGKTISFPGFLRAYVEGADDPDADLAEQEKHLPELNKGETIDTRKLELVKHETLPPSRFTEGSLIKELERRGIGRPSTWASVVDLVLSRSYAFKKGNALVPTFVAMALTSLLKGHFSTLLDYDFTAKLEDDLDAISRGERGSTGNLQYLSNFYFGNGHPGLKSLVALGGEKIDPREVCGIPLGETEDKKLIEVRIGRFGPFITDGERRTSVPEDVAPDELNLLRALEILDTANKKPEALGNHPLTGEPIYLKSGPYGPYIELGDPAPAEKEDTDKGKKGSKSKKEKKKRVLASLLPNTSPEDVNLEYALKLLSLPRTLGQNDSGIDVVATNGRFGPYVKCGEETRSIPLDELSPLEITLEQALALLKEPKRRGRAAGKPQALKEIGAHPTSGKQLVIKSGRYGPYVTDGEINASLPKDVAPENLSIEQAVSLLQARAAKIAEDGGTTTKRKRKKKA